VTDTEVQWVYTGRRYDEAKNKVYYRYQRIKDDGTLGEAQVMNKPIIINQFVGAVIKVTETESTVYIGGDKAPRYVETWGNDRQTSEWALDDEVARTRLSVDQLLRRHKKDAVQLTDLTIGQVKDAYFHARKAPDRAAILAAVFGAITQQRVSNEQG